jgi:hypothetical protein
VVVETWLTAYALEWERVTGGTFLYAKNAKTFRDLEKKHGRQTVLQAWSRCCDDHHSKGDVKYLSVPRFAEKFGLWEADRPPARHRHDEAEMAWLRRRRGADDDAGPG